MASQDVGEDPNLGNLIRLPRELRDMIWENVCPQDDELNPSSKNSLASLRTCRQIYTELSPKVYEKEVLLVRISPTYQIGSWLCFQNSRGAKWHVKDLEDARTRGFSNLPYKKLKGVKIEIEATECTRGSRD